MNRTEHDILILGAGMAGLTAARQLARSGARVAVLEARQRVGGRVWTRQVSVPDAVESIPVELGAEFVHGLPIELWALLQESQLESYELQGSALHFAAGRLQIADSEAPGEGVLGRMMGWIGAQPPGTDVGFGQYLDIARVEPKARKAALSYVEGFNAADGQLISVAALATQQRSEEEAHSERLFRLCHGYEGLPRFLALQAQQLGATILLGCAVRQVLWRPGEVTMNGLDGYGKPFSIRAARAVLTLPLGVLQSGFVRFDPAPAAILSAAQGLIMGAVIRMTLVFRAAFWRELKPGRLSVEVRSALEHLSFLFATDELPPTWWTPMPNRAPVMTAWVGGPRALARPESWLRQCLTTLAKITHLPMSYLQQQLISWHCHDWQTDQYARGAYSYVAVGALDSSRQLSVPVEHTLFFAGEHTDLSSNWGTVHGAICSGTRAAQQLLALT
jgi:monoamine oxidase